MTVMMVTMFCRSPWMLWSSGLLVSARICGNKCDSRVCYWLNLVIKTLNSYWLGAWAATTRFPPRCSLSSIQSLRIEVIADVIVEFLAEDLPKPDLEKLGRELGELKVDYNGNVVSVRRDLDARKVCLAWPAVGQAALTSALDFVTSPLKDELLPFDNCRVAAEYEPITPPLSRVYASDLEWSKLVAEGVKREIFVEVPDDQIMRDRNGERILNGAIRGSIKL